MYALLTPVSYWFGHPPQLRLDPESDLRTLARRLTRTATLDGGAVVADGGFCQADRTITLAIRDLSAADADLLEEIAATDEQVLSLPTGCYRGVVQGLTLNGGETAGLTFWVSARLDVPG